MRILTKTFTIFGALLLAQFAFVVLQSPAAFAASKLPKVEGLVNSEEQYGEHTYQVCRLTINAPPHKVQKVLTDYEQAPLIFSNVKKCRVVEDRGAVKKVSFSVNAPGNLWTFDYVLEISELPGSIKWHRLSGAFKKNEGFWKFEPADGGKATHVTYAKYVEGGGALPQFLVKKEVRESFSTIMANLKFTAEVSPLVADNEKE